MSKPTLPSRSARHNTSAIDSLFEQWDNNESPGAAIAVSIDGETVYRHRVGMANIAWSIPIGFDTVFEAGSVSKQVTAYAIHLLINEGTLSREDTVGSIMPELPALLYPISVDQLLTHTCGIRDHITSSILAGRFFEDRTTSAQVLQWLKLQRKLNHTPGEVCSYSNTGYFVLAQLVERLTGRTLAEFCRLEIFEPLRLTGTHFRQDYDREINNCAVGYYLDENTNYRAFRNLFAVPAQVP